jgi:hypothetical protein
MILLVPEIIFIPKKSPELLDLVGHDNAQQQRREERCWPVFGNMIDNTEGDA